MTRKQLFDSVITEAAHGDLVTLAGLVDYLINDRGIAYHKIVNLTARLYKLPIPLIVNTLDLVLPDSTPLYH